MSWRIPFRFLRGSIPQLVLTVGALAASVALFCALDLIRASLARAFAPEAGPGMTPTALLDTFGVIGFSVVAFIAYNRLSALFDERRRELATLRAVGVSREGVRGALLLESLALGALGVAIGLPAGILLANAVLPLVVTTVALNNRAATPAAAIALQWGPFLLAGGLGLMAALIAALRPASRAAAVDIVREVCGRQSERNLTSRARWRLCVGLAVAAGLAIVAQRLSHQPAWGLLATACLAALSGCAARPLLQLLRDSGVAQAAWLGATGRFAARELGASLGRTSQAAAMVAIGLGTLIWLGVLGYSFERSAVRVFDQAMRADVVVSADTFGAGALETPIDDGLAATLAAIDGVASVVGVRLATVSYQGQSIVLDTFDPAYFLNPAYGEWPLHGERLPNAWREVADGRAVVVSSNFAQNLNTRVGETITLESPNGPVPLVVAGVTTDFASPIGTLEMSRTVYRRHWNDETVTRFFVQAAPGEGRQGLRAAITERLSASGGPWRVISSADLVAYWGMQIQRAFGSAYVLAGIVSTILLLGIADGVAAAGTRSATTLERVGVSRRTRIAIAGLEAVAIGGCGLLLAIIAGAASAAVWIYGTIPYALGWQLQLHVPLWLLPLLGGVTVLTAGVCALTPQLRRHAAA